MQGQVFTWGCADNGSLGRVGDESMPMLIQVMPLNRLRITSSLGVDQVHPLCPLLRLHSQ